MLYKRWLVFVVSGKHYDDSFTEVIHIDSNVTTTASHTMNIYNSLYPGTTTSRSNKCQASDLAKFQFIICIAYTVIVSGVAQW